jgi:type VI secretion system secreted protein Hcp
MEFGSIVGDATLEGVKGWINLNHFEWHIDWNLTTRADLHAASRDAKRPKVDEVTVKKLADRASADLLKAVFTLNKPETCRIRFVRTDMPGRPYLEYTFYNTLITKLDSSADNDDRPTETIKLNFTEVEMCIFSTDTSGNDATKVPYRFPKYSILEETKAGSGSSPAPPGGRH